MPHSGSPSRKKSSRDKMSKDLRRHRRSRSRSRSESKSSKHSRRYYKKRSRSRTPSYHRSKYASSGKHTNSRSASSSYRSVTPERHRSHKQSSHERKKRRSSSSESSTSSYSEHSSSSVTEVKVSRGQYFTISYRLFNDHRVIILDKFKKSSRVPTPPPPPPITHNFTSVDLLDEPATQETIDLINDDEFVPRTFSSSKNIPDKVVIDLNTQTITVPTVEASEDVENTLFHPNVSFSYIIFVNLIIFLVVYLAVWR